ncbi:MAG TPA: hypothetical protein VFD36_30265 [Kofleriaceae bacterium]|nr:hypothetical protein [Kofleriaceae bacterium]
MSATSTRTISMAFSAGAITATPSAAAATNLNSPAAIAAPITLAPGDNTITVPTGGTVPTAVTIVKPTGNTSTIKIKGAGADTGVKLHLTDPDSISLDPTQATFILNASTTVTGLVLVWS